MIFLSYIVIIFGYLAPLVFILGIAYRIWNWSHRPAGFSWGLFPKPTKWTVTSVLFGRILALPTLIKSSREVLILALVMHFAILASIFLHLELFTSLSTETIIDIIGSSAGTVGVVLVGYFILRRVFVKETQEISAFSDYFWLSFLLIIIVLGTYLRVGDVVAPDAYRTFATSLITLSPTLPPANPLFLIHALLGEIYLMYIVSGKMMHSIGWLFTQYILVKERR